MTPARHGLTMRGMTDPGAPNLAPPDLGRLRAALAEAARWYRERLLVDRPPLVMATLADRGLADLSAQTTAGRRWQLGYAPAGRGSVAGGASARVQVQRSGAARRRRRGARPVWRGHQRCGTGSSSRSSKTAGPVVGERWGSPHAGWSTPTPLGRSR